MPLFRQLPILALLFLLVACHGRTNSESARVDNIALEDVDSIKISNNPSSFDDYMGYTKTLSEPQIRYFVEQFNSAKETKLRHAERVFVVRVKMKDGRSRSYSFKGSKRRVIRDYRFDMGNNQYVEEIWNDIDVVESRVKVIMKDSTLYSPKFINQIKTNYAIYDRVTIVDNFLFINDEVAFGYVIPIPLPLNERVVYRYNTMWTSSYLVVKRINFTTVEYQAFDLKKGDAKNLVRGSADINIAGKQMLNMGIVNKLRYHNYIVEYVDKPESKKNIIIGFDTKKYHSVMLQFGDSKARNYEQVMSDEEIQTVLNALP